MSKSLLALLVYIMKCNSKLSVLYSGTMGSVGQSVLIPERVNSQKLCGLWFFPLILVKAELKNLKSRIFHKIMLLASSRNFKFLLHILFYSASYRLARISQT